MLPRTGVAAAAKQTADRRRIQNSGSIVTMRRASKAACATLIIKTLNEYLQLTRSFVRSFVSHSAGGPSWPAIVASQALKRAGNKNTSKRINPRSRPA